DAMFYQNGKINSTLPFAETKQRFNINQYIQPNTYSANYSEQIRSRELSRPKGIGIYTTFYN
ncbi:MAG: hypothetical protein RQ733_08255, partial [Methyloprofundus sp.]|nr:hypothetical protein [Methyloprofundus sp.]